MAELTQAEIVEGLRALGVVPGDRLLVHSALAAIGRVAGGADTVIDALLEAVGPEGLVAVPTFYCEQPFDRRTSRSGLGAVADTLWRRPEAKRSLHPTHSVAGIGKWAAEFVADHEKAPTAYAEGTPYHRLALAGGKVLLMGADQDRNTLLHAAEAIVGVPYLGTRQGTYIDDEGREVTLTVPQMAGPHRDFIGLDWLFRERGIMRVGRIGGAVCRLMDAQAMLEAAIEALRNDPAAVLCDNPSCADCVMQRGKIKAARLAGEDFTLAAVAADISDDLDEVRRAAEGEGISHLELTPAEHRRWGGRAVEMDLKVAAIRGVTGDPEAVALARELGVPLVLPVSDKETCRWALLAAQDGLRVLMANRGQAKAFYQELYAETPDAPPLAFSPGAFARAGDKPFLGIVYHSTLRHRVGYLYVDDATYAGADALPGQGNGEVQEIISILRCRSFDGVMALRVRGRGVAAFRETAAAFWRLLDTM